MAIDFASLQGRVNGAVFRTLTNAEAVAGDGPFRVIFDVPYQAELGAENANPTCRVRETDLAANSLAHGSPITINGTAYTVTAPPQPDGTGVVLLQLRRTS